MFYWFPSTSVVHKFTNWHNHYYYSDDYTIFLLDVILHFSLVFYFLVSALKRFSWLHTRHSIINRCLLKWLVAFLQPKKTFVMATERYKTNKVHLCALRFTLFIGARFLTRYRVSTIILLNNTENKCKIELHYW